MKYDVKTETGLMRELWDLQVADYPERFVQVVYPWGKKDTPLERFKGPKAWQVDTLKAVGEYIRENKRRQAAGEPLTMLRDAVGSGRGIGKSAELGMLAHWFMSTRVGGTCIVSANGEPQLRGATFPEIKKWFTLSINSHWFDETATNIFPAKWFADALKKQLKLDCSYYFTQAKLWTEENPDAYAGPHSQIGTLLIFDEGSGIPVPIWDTAEGFFSDVHNPSRIWMARSNCRRNTGGFYDAFHKTAPDGKRFWRCRSIDSREVEGTDKEQLQRIIDKYGEDSDTARVEVKGMFPRTGEKQFVPADLAREAQRREVVTDYGAPLVMGVDVARYGGDKTVCRFRRGRDARSIPAERWKGASVVESAKRVALLIDEHKPDAICIDQGMGSAVIDILRSLKYRGIHEIAFGGGSSNPEWYNKRTEMFALARDFLGIGAIDGNEELFEELIAAEYYFIGDKINIESNDDIKKRIGRSSDEAAAFLLTFAASPARRDSSFKRRATMAQDVDYKIF